MLCCICKEKEKPKHDSMIDCIKAIFEIGSIRLICILQTEGRVISMYAREDVTGTETDNLLQKAAAIKAQSIKLSSLQGEKCRSLHVQGNHICTSMFDLPDGTLLVYFLDCNPLTSNLTFIYDSRAYIQANIAELFGKN